MCKRAKLRGSPKALITKVINLITGLINASGYGNIIKDKRNEMGDRGSKSDTKFVSVKEQRVDGSSED